MTIVHRIVNLNWVTGAFIPLMVILMEVLWVYPWLAWAGKWQALTEQRPPLSLTSLIFLMGVSFLVTKFFLSKTWHRYWIQLTVVSSGLVAILLVARIEYGSGFGLLSGHWFAYVTQALLDSLAHPHPMVIALVAGVYLWWRGVRWGRSAPFFEDIYRSFLFGLIALIMLILILGANSESGALENLLTIAGLYIAGFFFFGLAALALANLKAIHKKMLIRDEVAQVFSRRWLIILFGVVGGIVLMGIGIASIFSSDLVALLGRSLNLVAELLLQIVRYLLLPMGYIVVGLFYAIQFIINLLPQGQRSQPLQSADRSFVERWQEEINLGALPPEAFLVIKWGLFTIVAVAVIFLLTRAVFRYWPSRTEGDIEEVQESLWNWNVFKADLRLFLSLIWQRFKRKRKQPVPTTPIPIWYGDEDMPSSLDIREIYRHLLWEAACSGITRNRHETAYEYAERLGQAVPEGGEQLAQLTNLYIDARYGDLKVQDKQAARANSLWKVFRRLLRRLRGA